MILNQPAFTGQLAAMEELVSLALQIAKRQRGENHLQEHDILKIKLLREYGEFEEAIASKSRLDVLSELADLTYYNTCSFALDEDERDLQEVQRYICQRCGATVEQAYLAALAKYRLRATNPKNIEVENEAIRIALDIPNK